MVNRRPTPEERKAAINKELARAFYNALRSSTDNKRRESYIDLDGDLVESIRRLRYARGATTYVEQLMRNEPDTRLTVSLFLDARPPRLTIRPASSPAPITSRTRRVRGRIGRFWHEEEERKPPKPHPRAQS